MKKTVYAQKDQYPMFLQLSKATPTYFMFFFFLAMLFVQILIFSIGHFKSCFFDQNSLNEPFSHVCAGISPPDDNALLSVCLAHHPVGVCAHCASGPWGRWGAESVWNSAWSLLSWVVGRSVPLLWQGKWTLENASSWRKRHWTWFCVYDTICIKCIYQLAVCG